MTKSKLYLLCLAFGLMTLSGCDKSKTIHPAHKSITEAVYASGFVAAKNSYKIFALTDGNIVQKFHGVGDVVNEGDALYRVQNEGPTAKLSASQSAYKLALENARENSPVMQDLLIKIKSAETLLANDQATYNRYKNMYDANAVSKSDYDKAATNLEVSKNNLQAAKEAYTRSKEQLNVDAQNAQAQMASSGQDLSNYIIKSLIDGVIYETYKELGEAVKRNEAVALVGEKGGKYLQLAVDQQDIGRVKEGQDVVVKMDIASDKVYKAKVSKVYPNMNANDQSFRVDASFADDPGLQFINASVEANIVIATKDNALVLPRQSVNANNEVQINTGGKKKTVKVQTGLKNLSEIEILSGIGEQDEVLMPKQ
jgi:multidrug efflux pump subunit AcrA (membrane-fusion protein)